MIKQHLSLFWEISEHENRRYLKVWFYLNKKLNRELIKNTDENSTDVHIFIGNYKYVI